MKSLFVLFSAALFLTSCNTTIGFGRDLRLLGEGMEKSAHRARQGQQQETDTHGAPVY